VHRAAIVAIAAALSFSPKSSCLEKPQKRPEAEAPPPPPAPITSATAPPIWNPPDTTGAVASSSTPATPPSPELVKARAAADAKDFKKVRALLEKKVVRSAKAVPEESQLVYRACVHLKDSTCSEAVKAKHPDHVTE
jgi:hypothetical protein